MRIGSADGPDKEHAHKSTHVVYDTRSGRILATHHFIGASPSSEQHRIDKLLKDAHETSRVPIDHLATSDQPAPSSRRRRGPSGSCRKDAGSFGRRAAAADQALIAGTSRFDRSIGSMIVIASVRKARGCRVGGLGDAAIQSTRSWPFIAGRARDDITVARHCIRATAIRSDPNRRLIRDPPEALLAPEHREHVEDAGRGRAAGQRRAQAAGRRCRVLRLPPRRRRARRPPRLPPSTR